MKKRAILMVSFGTTCEEARKETLNVLARDIQAAYPDFSFLHAFSSGQILRILEKSGTAALSPEAALEQLCRENYDQVIVLPVFLAPGGEHRRLLDRISPWENDFSRFTTAKPLLYSPEDIDALAAILTVAYPSDEKNALLFMGHGIRNNPNLCHDTLAARLQAYGNVHSYVAMLHGQPDLNSVLGKLTAGKYDSVTLVPLMLTAGTHTVTHMAGSSPDSWKNQCTAAGLTVHCRISGLAQLPQVRQLYLQHLARCMV